MSQQATGSAPAFPRSVAGEGGSCCCPTGPLGSWACRIPGFTLATLERGSHPFPDHPPPDPLTHCLLTLLQFSTGSEFQGQADWGIEVRGGISETRVLSAGLSGEEAAAGSVVRPSACSNVCTGAVGCQREAC